MKIGGMGQAAPMSGQARLQQTDSVSKNIQRQIANKQKELQNLSSNEDMDMEAKSKKRQEIMQEINDLNNQLRQRQIEQRQAAVNDKKSQGKGTSMDDMLGGGRQGAKGKGGGLSQANMKAMISADLSMGQAKVQGSVAKDMEHRAGVLKAEIKQDGGRSDVEAKKKELAEVEKKMETALASQINTLAEAKEELDEVEKSAGQESTGSKKEEKETAASKGNSSKKEEKETAAVKGNSSKKEEKETAAVKGNSSKKEEETAAGKTGGKKGEKEDAIGIGKEEGNKRQAYPSVDIYL